MVRAFASQLVDLGSTPLSIRTKYFKTVFAASLLQALRKRNCIEKNPESSLIVALGKSFNGSCSSLGGKQVKTLAKRT